MTPETLASAFVHRTFGILSVETQRAVHELIGINYGRTTGLSRPEAGEVEHWESILASDAASGGLTTDDPDLQ